MTKTQTPFDVAVEALMTAEIDEILPALHHIFSGITKMDTDKVIAAYQFMETCSAVKTNLRDNPVFIRVEKALINQMHNIVRDGNPFGETHDRFNDVTSTKLFRG